MSTFTSPVPGTTAAPTVVPVRKKSRRKWWIITAIVVVVGLIVAAVVKGKHAVMPTTVTTEKSVIRTITHLVTATGKVQPEIEVGIAPEVSGELIALPFKEGQPVKTGDVIIRIKPDFYAAQADQQEAALSSSKASSMLAKANQDKAEEDYRRADDLYKKKLISDADYTAAKTNQEVARANYAASLANIRQTEGALNQFRDQLSKTTLYAPMDGTISVLNSEVGERVVATGQFAGTEVMRIANLNNVKADVVDEVREVLRAQLRGSGVNALPHLLHLGVSV